MDGLYATFRSDTDMVDYAVDLYSYDYLFVALDESLRGTKEYQANAYHQNMVLPASL